MKPNPLTVVDPGADRLRKTIYWALAGVVVLVVIGMMAGGESSTQQTAEAEKTAQIQLQPVPAEFDTPHDEKPAILLPAEQSPQQSVLQLPPQITLPPSPPLRAPREPQPRPYREPRQPQPVKPNLREEARQKALVAPIGLPLTTVQDTQKQRSQIVSPTVVENPSSPYRLAPGTVINVAVQTAITSDAEGTIIARTLFDVMDTATQSVVLLPAGSILVGNRAQAPTYGQNLIQIGFTQISFPTGALASMKALEGHSLDGSAGIAGEVDHHYLRIFGTALVMAGVATGIQVGANTGQSRGNYYSPASAATNAVSNELGRTANTVLRREFETAPTLTLQQGEEILLVLQDPMEFEAPYNG